MKNYVWKDKWTTQIKINLSQIEKEILSETGDEYKAQKDAIRDDVLNRSYVDISEEEVSKLKSFVAKKLNLESLDGLVIQNALLNADLETELVQGFIAYAKDEEFVYKQFTIESES